TGSIDNNGSVTNSSQTIDYGQDATAMVFTPAAGYQITGVSINGSTPTMSGITLNNDGSYTYTAQNVTAPITVDVTTTVIPVVTPVMQGYTYGDTPSTPSITLANAQGGSLAVGSSSSAGSISYQYCLNGTNAWQTWDITNPPALDAGSYQIRAEIGAGASTTGAYVPSAWSAPLTFQVAARDVTITVAPASKVAGSSDPAFTGTVTGLVNGDSLNVNYYRSDADQGAGTYSGVITASFMANSNYNVTVVPADFTIAAAPVTPTPAAPAATTGTGTTGGNGGNGGSALVSGTSTATIAPTQTPTASASEITNIPDQTTPLSSAGSSGDWALINLLLMLLGVIIAAALLITYVARRTSTDDDDDDDTQTTRKKHIAWRVLATAVAIIAIIAFFLTENMAMPMIMTDSWTILMAVLFVIELAFGILGSIKSKDTQDTNEPGYNGQAFDAPEASRA
ncbi:MAG: hypothetical protein LBM21_00900, partial [Coriobacteriales bacterium]|nr:hypothetical protein [Coriobacteriales bacterium]